MRAEVFSGVIERLADDFDCHALNLPGHDIKEATFPPTIDGAADMVANYIVGNAMGSAIIVGWSLGAMVAWNLSRRHPEVSLGGIVVIDMSPKIVNDGVWKLGIRNFEAIQNNKALGVMLADWNAYAARVNAGMYASDSSTPHPETLRIIRSQNPEAMAKMWASLANADERATISDVPCPMLIFKGAKSRIYPPETGRFIAENARSAKLVRMEHSGHAPHLEEPEHFTEILKEWIAGVGGPR